MIEVIGLMFALAIAFGLMHASQGSQPTFMHVRENRCLHGTPRRLNARLLGGGYQPTNNGISTHLPPPKRP
jgi:hypothetical protein